MSHLVTNPKKICDDIYIRKEDTQMDYVKIILTSYPKLDHVIMGYRDCISLRCRNSMFFWESPEEICAKVIEKKLILERLVDLKRKIDVLLSRLTDDEKDLIYAKYLGKPPRKKFNFSKRTYYRKQNKLLLKIKKYLSYLRIDEDTFERDFMYIPFFKLMNEVCEDIKHIKILGEFEKELFVKKSM